MQGVAWFKDGCLGFCSGRVSVTAGVAVAEFEKVA